jgi:hypothetical protein
MGFLPKAAASAVAGSAGGAYLNPSKIQAGTSVRFRLLNDQPLCFHELWAEAGDGSVKPFRFAEEPTDDDIQVELGANYARRANRDGTGLEPLKFAIAVPVWDYDKKSVSIMQLSQKSLIRELDAISQQEDYKNLLEWDFSLGREGAGLSTEYKLMPLPRRKADDKEIDEALDQAMEKGFDITRLLGGGNPFQGGGDA